MASKVQETIEHNRTAFANQVALIDRQIVQKSMFAWKTYHYQKQAKMTKLRRALNRILRGTLSRAFYHWKDHYQAKDKSKAMRQKVCLCPPLAHFPSVNELACVL
jgi:hypoxanthine phosphoribosyltransferase